MITKVKTMFGTHHRKLLFIIFLFVGVLLLVSLFSYTLMAGTETPLENVVHVNSESGLKNAVDNAGFGVPVVIVLDSDIALTWGALGIPAGKDIALSSNNKENGFYQLIGAMKGRYDATILVESGGVLRLDGIIVTHADGVSGTGIGVYEGGTLIMYAGKISGNYNPERYLGHGSYMGGSGGVDNRGVFEMFGGEIAGNTGKIGGGVSNRGKFTMYDGTISNNNAESGSYSAMAGGSGYGGGVDNNGNFTMYDGTISNNNAGYSGGGIASGGDFTMHNGKIIHNKARYGGGVYSSTFEMFGGEITKNTVVADGGGIYNCDHFTMHDGKISDNKAGGHGGGIYNSEYHSITCNILSGEVADNTVSEGNNIYPIENDTIKANAELPIAVICVSVIVIVAIAVGGLLLYYKQKNRPHQIHF